MVSGFFGIGVRKDNDRLRTENSILASNNRKLETKVNMLSEAQSMIMRFIQRQTTNYDLNLMLSDVVDTFLRKEDGFVHPEITVLNYNCRFLKGLSFKEFEKHDLSYMVDTAHSKFSKEELETLEPDIKQTIYLLLNNEERIHVENTGSEIEIRRAYDPIFQQLSEGEVMRSIDDKLRKTKEFGIKEHVSVPLLTSDGKKKTLIGYIHAPIASHYDIYVDNALMMGANAATSCIHHFFNHQRKENSINSELEAARLIQSHFLGSKLPSFDWLDIATKYLPVRSIGGDFYRFLKIDDSRLVVLIGDASGHGIGAASIANVSSQIFKTALSGAVKKGNLSLPDIMHEANDEIFELLNEGDSKEGSFVTAFIGLFDYGKKSFSYCRGGHPPTLFCHNHEFSTLENDGILLGESSKEELVRKGIEFKLGEVGISPGDKFVFYTDGIVEVMDPKGEFYKPLLSEHTLACCELPPAEYIDLLVDKINNFIAGRPLEDDATLLVVDVKN